MSETSDEQNQGIDGLLPKLAEADAAREVRGTGQSGQVSSGNQTQTMTPEQALAQISLIRADKNHLYNRPSPWDNQANQRAKDEVEKLYRAAYPESPERQNELPEHKGLHDIIVKEFGSKDTGEKIENEADALREKIEDEKAEQQFQKAESELKQMWGSSFEENQARMFFLIDRMPASEGKEKFLNAFSNDVEMCDLIQRIAKKLDVSNWNGQAKIYRRKEKE